MTDPERPPALPASTDPREDLGGKLRALEEFVARAESSGEEVPPEAILVVAHLREIMSALDGLTKELDA